MTQRAYSETNLKTRACSLATAGTQEQTNNNLSLIYFDSSETNKQKLP